MNAKKTSQSEWFRTEILPHEADLRTWLTARFSSYSEIDDVIQESYFRLLKANDSGPIVNPRAYLFVTAKNIILGRLRHLTYERPKGFKEMDPLEIVDESKSPLDEATQNDEIRILIEAIQSLPKRCCQVMTLRKIYGYSQKEVAAQLKMKVNTVQVQSAIGLRKCEEYFKKIGYRKGESDEQKS